MKRTRKFIIAALFGLAGAIGVSQAMAQECPPFCTPFLVQLNRLGATFTDSTVGLGAVVATVKGGGSFDKAGIQVGDTILSINGTAVTSAAQALTVFDNPAPNTTATVQVKDVTTGTVASVFVTY